MRNFLIIMAVLLLIILVLGIGPFLTLWSLNTLFSLQIAYNIWTWLAMIWIQLVAVCNFKHYAPKS